MRFLSTTALLLLGSLQGCIPLPQMEQRPSRIPFSANYDLGDKHVLFAIGSENRPKDYEIIPQRSYVIDPSGTRHPIRIGPHDYDVAEHFPFIRDDIFVLRSEADPKPISLRDGTWKFALAWRRSGTNPSRYVLIPFVDVLLQSDHPRSAKLIRPCFLFGDFRAHGSRYFR